MGHQHPILYRCPHRAGACCRSHRNRRQRTRGWPGLHHRGPPGTPDHRNARRLRPGQPNAAYEASGLPTFIVTARNTWSVSPTGERTCRVTLSAHFETRGMLGLLGRWAILAQVRYTSRHLEADLRHFIKHGTPSPRKQRQLSRAQHH